MLSLASVSTSSSEILCALTPCLNELGNYECGLYKFDVSLRILSGTRSASLHFSKANRNSSGKFYGIYSTSIP